MQFNFLKNINLLLSAIIFAVSISAFVGFIYLKKDNRLAYEVKRLVDRRLPEANLLEAETKKDFYNEVVEGDVILVYSRRVRTNLILLQNQILSSKQKYSG
mgnify:FL=1